MIRARFFADLRLGEPVSELSFLPAKVCFNWKTEDDQKRIWIEVDLPEDKDLWPEAFQGPVYTAKCEVEK